MPASEYVQRGDTKHQQAAGRQNTREFGERSILVAAREVHYHVEAYHHIKCSGTKRESGNVALAQARQLAGSAVLQAVHLKIEWEDPPAITPLHAQGVVAGAAAGLEDPMYSTLAGQRIEHSEQDLPLPSIPPKVLLGSGYVCEFSGIHIALPFRKFPCGNFASFHDVV
jgi:hypothetical protein